MIGLIFGETQFPKEILKKIKKIKINYFIIDLSTNRIFNKEKNVNYVSLGQFGKIIALDKAYKKIFSSENLHENLDKINGEYKDNELVTEVIKFIEKDKKRPICSPQK